MISKINAPSWYHEPLYVCLNRLQALTIVGTIELTLKHPDLTETARVQILRVGRTLSLMLIEDGIILPDEVLRAWEKAFCVKYELRPDENLEAVYLDNYGRLLK